jgi:putative hydrolase of the HAD superfamily
MMFELIAFDADDTLWHSETLYHHAQDRLRQLLTPYADGEQVSQVLYATEMRNLQLYGYGIKGFVLSMIEAAIELTAGQIKGYEVAEIIDLAKEMKRAPVRLLDGAREVVQELSATYPLMLITKGDLLDQQTKLARSGLADRFAHVEVVSDKTKETYRRILARCGVDAERFLMVGNSLRSDILPVAAIGGHAVYIPHHITWAHEMVSAWPASEPADAVRPAYIELEHIGLLPEWISRRR